MSVTDFPKRFHLDLAHALNGDINWLPFRAGIEIHRICGDGSAGASSALLRYAPGARLPCHEHDGYEHILVLSGSQFDEHGRYPTGTLTVSTPGSKHSVGSDEGCVVLAIWGAPVRFDV